MKIISEIFSHGNTWIAPREARNHMLNKYIIFFALCGHTLFIPVFFLLNRDIPFYNNLLCVFLDIFCLYMNSRGNLRTVYTIFIAEISYHTFFCNIIFGWSTGFIFYFFTLTFYIFIYRKFIITRIILFSVIILLFIFQYFYLQSFSPEYPSTIIPVWLIYFFNAAANFTAIAFLAAEFSFFVDAAESALLKAKDKAEEGERAKSLFLAKMSHEIRSPLNSIVGMINLSFISDNDHEKNQYLYTARESAGHLLTVINDILDYSKIEESRMSLNIETFNLHHLVKNTMMAMDSSIYGRELTMNYKISDEIPAALKGDPSRIRQVLINLISNSIKFTENGSIMVRCEMISSDENYCTINFSVEDTGIGIPEDLTGKIFERFTQIEVDLTRNYRGTGLGLTISRELVELMGGTIDVKSTPGEGSIFSFQISLARITPDDECSPTYGKTDNNTSVKNLKVLIAEDIFTNWMLYEKYMQILGHSFKIVENGNMALDELERDTYDLILMDVEMPEMNGEETLNIIRSGIRGGNRNIPVIAMTGYSKNDLKSSDCSFNGFLIKPVEIEDLEKMIANVMEEAMCPESA